MADYRSYFSNYSLPAHVAKAVGEIYVKYGLKPKSVDSILKEIENLDQEDLKILYQKISEMIEMQPKENDFLVAPVVRDEDVKDALEKMEESLVQVGNQMVQDMMESIIAKQDAVLQDNYPEFADLDLDPQAFQELCGEPISIDGYQKEGGDA